MKKILSVLAIMLAAIFVVGCSGDNQEDLPNTPEEPKITLLDFEGVWENGNEDMFFSVTSDGYVLYNMWGSMLGRGKGTLKNDTLIVKNDYSRRTDSLIIYSPVKDHILIRGKVFGKDTNKPYIAGGIPFSRSSKLSPVTSFAGDYWNGIGGLNAYFGSFKDKYVVLNDYIFQEQITYTSGRYDTREHYYVPREINSKFGARRLYYAGYGDDEVKHFDYFPSR